MKYLSSNVVIGIGAVFASIASAADIVYDAEYYILQVQNGERWAADDALVDAKLAAFREQNRGNPPNIIMAYNRWPNFRICIVSFYDRQPTYR